MRQPGWPQPGLRQRGWSPTSPRRRGRRGPPASDAREQALRACDFPLYGLDASFEGRRWVGGHGAANGVLSEVELAHGDALVEGAPLVRVRTRRPDPGAPRELAAGDAARDLSTRLWHEGSAEHRAVRAAFVDDDPLGSWDDVAVPVSGEPVAFKRLAAGAAWVALGHVGAQLVSLFARHVPLERVRLERVADVDAYLADDGGRR